MRETPPPRGCLNKQKVKVDKQKERVTRSEGFYLQWKSALSKREAGRDQKSQLQLLRVFSACQLKQVSSHTPATAAGVTPGDLHPLLLLRTESPALLEKKQISPIPFKH